MTDQPQSPPDAGELAQVDTGPAPDPDVELIIGDAGPRGRRATRRTIHAILTEDPRWTGRIRFDTFGQVILWDGRPVTDADLTRGSCWIEEVYQATPSLQLMNEVVSCVADERRFHPVHEYLDDLSWDGRERVPSLLSTYAGAEDTPLVRGVSRAFLVSAVARVMRPGCKCDTLLVLIGPQGAGKSRFCRALVPADTWFADTPLDLRSKDAFLNLRGKWLYEIAEMDGLRGRAAARVKSFLSSSTDHYRAPYERSSRDHRRQCVLVGTANHSDLLSDSTGSRRFWPIEVGTIDLKGVERDRDQLWAEASARYRHGETWHLPEELEKLRRAEQGRFQTTDPYIERLEVWLQDEALGESFTTGDALAFGLGVPVDRIDRSLQTRIGSLLKSLGCRKFRSRSGGIREWRWRPPQRSSK